MRWLFALFFSCACGLTLDFGPRASQSTDAGDVMVPDAEETPGIDPEKCTLEISRIVDIVDFQAGAVDAARIGDGMFGAHRRATGKTDPPVIAERVAGATLTQVAETDQLSNVDRVVVRGSLGGVLVGSLNASGLGEGSLNSDTWGAPFPLMTADAFDVAGTGDRNAPWILGVVSAGTGALNMQPLSSSGTRMGAMVTVAGSYRDLALAFEPGPLVMHIALVGRTAPHEISYVLRDAETARDTIVIDTVDVVPLDELSPTIRIVEAGVDRYVLYANSESSYGFARLSGPAPFTVDTRDELPGENAVAAFNPRLPNTLAVAFIRDGILEIELRDRFDVTRRQNRLDPLLAVTNLAMMPAAHPSALYVALAADGGSGKYLFIDCVP